MDRDGGVENAFNSRPKTLADYLALLGRRKWLIAVPLVLAPVVAYVLTSTQSPLYKSSAEVYVKRADIAAAVAGVTDPTLQVDPDRFLKTQASVARDPKLATRVVDRAGVPGMTAGRLLGSSAVSARSDQDLLDVSVTNENPQWAQRLTNVYADEFTKYRTELDTARVEDALQNVKDRIASLSARGISLNSPAYVTLLQNQTQLETVGKLLADNTQLLQPAAGATKLRPQPRRNVLLGLLLGAVVGIGIAFAGEALDRRVRSEREIEEALRLPLLGRLPKPARSLRREGRIVMLAAPRSAAAEPVRKLRTNIEFMNVDQKIRTIMVTSSVQQEGKSTTSANLAVALARAGRRVALVDLDLRRPFVSRFLGIPPELGITDVVAGRIDLNDALRPVPVPVFGVSPNGRSQRVAMPVNAQGGNGHGEIAGMLHVLTAGTPPADAGEFVGREEVASLLQSLGSRFDLVLVDAPPLLAVGDAMALSAHVDAMCVVVRLNVVHRGMLQELARLLDACPAAKLGYVLTGAELSDEGYGYAYAYDYAAPEARTSGKSLVR
jgi:tyrosine-protein kinase